MQLQDIKFTVQNAQLYILEVDTARRSAKAAIKVCTDLVRERVISEREAILRINTEQLQYFEKANTAAIDSVAVTAEQPGLTSHHLICSNVVHCGCNARYCGHSQKSRFICLAQQPSCQVPA